MIRPGIEQLKYFKILKKGTHSFGHFRQNVSLSFHKICLSERLLLNYTHTHNHTYTHAHTQSMTYIYIYIYTCIIIIIIMWRYQHRYFWPSLANSPYHLLLLAGPAGYIQYRHRDAECRFELDVQPVLVYVKGSIGVHHLRVPPYVLCTNIEKIWIRFI